MRTQSFAELAVAAALVVTIVATPRPAGAGTIFAQPPVNGTGSSKSDLTTPGPEQKADNFSLAFATTPNGIRWWGPYSGPEAGPYVYQVRFYNDAAGLPAAAPFYNQTLTGVSRVPSTAFTNSSSAVSEFFGTIPAGPALAAGTPYHVSVVDNSADTVLFWMCSTPGGQFVRLTEGSAWSVSGITDNLAFELYDVPEPTTPALATLAAGPLLLRRSRRV